MDTFIDNISAVLQQVFGIELGETSIGGGAVFLFLFMFLLLGKAFVTHIQEFLKVNLKNKRNFSIVAVFIAGILLYFFLDLPFSLVVWIIVGAGTIIVRLVLGTRLSIRVCVLICIIIGIISPCIELIYGHYRYLNKKQSEVYFLLPLHKNLGDSAELAEIRKSLYNVFMKVFDIKGLDVLESIVIFPKSYMEYENKFQINAAAEPSLVKKVLSYGRAEKISLDIVIRGVFQYHKKESLIVLLVNYQKPDANNQRLVNFSSPDRIKGVSNDLEWISILACNKFIGFIRNRKIKIGAREFAISEYEKHLLKNILTEYQNFLLTQPEVNRALLKEVDDLLISESKISYEQTSRLLESYSSLTLSETFDDQAEGVRAAVKKKYEFRNDSQTSHE